MCGEGQRSSAAALAGTPSPPHKDLQRQGEWTIEAINAVARLPECDREGAVPRACPACQGIESLSRAFMIWPNSQQAFVYYECTAGRCRRRWMY